MKLFKKCVIFVFVILLINNFSFSQNAITKDSLSIISKSIEKANLTFNLPMLQNIYTTINREIKTDPNNTLLSYYRGLAEYRFLSFSFDTANAEIFGQYYDTAKSHAEIIITNPDFESEGKTLLAGIYMIRLAINKMEAPILSFQMNTLLDEALKINPENPRALLLKSIMKAQTPVAYGGNKKEALKIILKAVSIFENSPSDMKISWGYLEALAWLGQIQADLNQFEEAEFSYNKALSIEPDYNWIKYSLLPQLEKRKNKK